MSATAVGHDFATRAIHYGYDPQRYQGALSPPVFMSSTFAFPTAEYGGACFAGTEPGYFYSRIANPTLNLLEQRIANLEEGEAAVAFASGMGLSPRVVGRCSDRVMS